MGHMALTNDVVSVKISLLGLFGPINKGFKMQIGEKMKGIIIKTRKIEKR